MSLLPETRVPLMTGRGRRSSLGSLSRSLAALSSELAQVVAAARAHVRGGEITTGFQRLTGGISHDVFRCAADGDELVLKVYRSFGRDEPLREWDALRSLSGTGLAPEPILLDLKGDAPVLVMTDLAGETRDPLEWSGEHIELVGRAHRAVHVSKPVSDRTAISHPAEMAKRTRSMLAEWRSDATHLVDAGPEVCDAGQLAAEWIATREPDRLVASCTIVFSRGDANLTNYLWHDGRVRLVDWEDSGMSDPAFELGDMAEHLTTRALDEDLWDQLRDATGLTHADRARVAVARRLMACFWLAVVERRKKRNDPIINVDLPTQADRVLKLFGSPVS
jgi:aminoglycoside phosphotransferase (APT) family kinase protein